MNQHQKMEVVLKYITDHFYEKITLENAAKKTGYSQSVFSNAFSSYTGMSFTKFLRKYRLRQAAQEIHGGYGSLEIVGRRNGFQSKKFYEAFREEFGITPKNFRDCDIIPDMPLAPEINGHAFSMEYKKLPDVVIEGYPMRAVNGDETDLLDEVAYPFRHPGSRVDLHCKEKHWGVWWHDRERGNHLCYVMGTRADETKEPEKGCVRVKITGGDYAVFSVERGRDYFDIANTSREMAWYVFHVWQMINHKQTDKMGFTYEAFDSEKSYLFVPLLKGFGGIEIEKDMGGNMIEELARYVDEHILENIDIDTVISHFGRSSFYCRDRFQSCYKISLPDYIRRKRLYVLCQKMEDGEITGEDLIQNYGFLSVEQYRREFYKEFRVEPEQYKSVTLELIDLKEYYTFNFRRLKKSERMLESFRIAGKIIKSGENRQELDLDVPGIAEFWMENDFPGLGGGKAALYESEIIASGRQDTYEEKIVYNYVLGPVVTGEENLPEDMHPITVSGGKYAVFENTEADIEGESLAERIRLMMRCIDHVWIYDNWMRTDFQSRVSFLYYEDNRLYYFVPIYGK